MIPTLQSLGVPFQKTGSLVVAMSDTELAALSHIVEANHALGDEARLLSLDELLQEEPAINPRVRGAALVAGEVFPVLSILTLRSWLTRGSWRLHLQETPIGVGHAFSLTAACRRSMVRWRKQPWLPIGLGGPWTLQTTQGLVAAEVVINCAGLFADTVEGMVRAPSFEIKPRRVSSNARLTVQGDYIVYERMPGLVRRPLQPMPTDHTKGVFVFPSLYGHIVVGPTAVDTDDRVPGGVSSTARRTLMEKGG